MADKPFRVLLDLTDLRIECLKYVWINVSPQELKTIADFKTSLIQKINLDQVDIKLFVRNGLLLDDETVTILREDDTVKVHYIDQHQSGSYTENCVKESKRSSRKRNHSETSDLSLNIKKCKGDNEVSTQEKEVLYFIEKSNKKKKKHKHKQSPSLGTENLCNQSKTFEIRNNTRDNKNEKEITLEKNITDFNLHRKSDSFFSFLNEHSTVEENKNKAFKTDINVDFESCLKLDSTKHSLPVNNISHEPENGSEKTFAVNTETVKQLEGHNNNCPKKKRKRRKKRKQVLETVDTFENTELNKEFKSFTNETDKSAQRKHFIYKSSSCEKDEVIQLGCDSKKEEEKDLNIDTFLVEGVSNVNAKPNTYPKISTPAQSDFCKNPNWCSSLMQQTDLNSHYNETMEFKKGKIKYYADANSVNQHTLSFDNTENNEKSPGLCYANLPPLNSRPDIGDHIAYKILELDEHYSPVISNYREGIVKSINIENEEMQIELLKHEIKPGRTGKFENLKEDEVPLPEVKTCDIVRWSTLVEPKLLIEK